MARCKMSCAVELSTSLAWPHDTVSLGLSDMPRYTCVWLTPGAHTAKAQSLELASKEEGVQAIQVHELGEQQLADTSGFQKKQFCDFGGPGCPEKK